MFSGEGKGGGGGVSVIFTQSPCPEHKMTKSKVLQQSQKLVTCSAL